MCIYMYIYIYMYGLHVYIYINQTIVYMYIYTYVLCIYIYIYWLHVYYIYWSISSVYISISISIYIYHGCNSFIRKRSFSITFANLPRNPRLSFARVSCQNRFLNLSPKKHITFANSENNFRGVSCWNPGGLCNGQSLHGPLNRSTIKCIIYNYAAMHAYIYI